MSEYEKNAASCTTYQSLLNSKIVSDTTYNVVKKIYILFNRKLFW